MSECCCPGPEIQSRRACPSCSAPATAVDVATVKALLTPRALARMLPAGFHFCASEHCDSVYFSGDGQVFTTGDVRIDVWQKQPGGARTICYCFGENERDMAAEIAAHGRTSAVERVRGHIAHERCACEVHNPRGACCLGELMAAVKRLGAD